MPRPSDPRRDVLTGLLGLGSQSSRKSYYPEMLARLEERDAVPKIMFINTSAEYWRGDAGLIHTDLETMTDAHEESESVRR